MDFNKGWDVSLIEDWLSTRNEFAVLTVYPESVDRIDQPAGNKIVAICGYTLEEGIPRGRQAQGYKRSEARLLTPNWAAGFSFHRFGRLSTCSTQMARVRSTRVSCGPRCAPSASRRKTR